MNDKAHSDLDLGRQRREQMLRLVAKGFFTELVNYGVEKSEVLRVASHLLDNVMGNGGAVLPGQAVVDGRMRLDLIEDRWQEGQELGVGDVVLRPLGGDLAERMLYWLDSSGIRSCFVTPLPETVDGLRVYLENPQQRYLAIVYQGDPVGFVGGENIDPVSGKLEMKKCVGDPELRGKGIGKRATFAFLYYAFRVLGMHKIYIYSRDINMRNINLNSRLGFEVEGIFLEDLVVNGARQDVVRMALVRPVWEGLVEFGQGPNSMGEGSGDLRSGS
jgi:RimJ/RimL family protein N-acetyltransferase